MLFCLLGLFATDPQTPADELKSFKTIPGITVSLAAAEPDVVDPVAIAFDEMGRMLVVEMRGYPNGGVGTGSPNFPGRIRRLEDRDGDGQFETSSVYVDGLRFPTAVMPWRKGVLVGDAPDLLYFADEDNDGKAEKRTVLYTGFGNKNIQQMINSLQLHWDGWVYGCNGANESDVRSKEKPDAVVVPLRGRNFRFHPDVPGSIEPMSGGGQFGMSCNEEGAWFTCTNSEHIKQIVFEDRYLRNNPALALPGVTVNISDHGSACQVFRVSKFEEWRVERTSRRAAGKDRNRFAATELVPGGFITSGCGTLVYRGDALPSLLGDILVCDPANNLIHRDTLRPNGVTYIAERRDSGVEFLASTDNWFRPTFLAIGPDGAIYVTDFYREVIETPLSLPEDIQKKYNLQSRERGRVWRISGPESKALTKLGKMQSMQLVDLLDHPNVWTRLTAQRLLIERQPHKEDVVARLKQLAETPTKSIGAKHAIGTGLSLKLDMERAVAGALLPDRHSSLQQAVMAMIEPISERSAAVRGQVASMDEAVSERVRFQAACTLGGAKSSHVVRALVSIIKQSPNDPWIQAGVLSGVGANAGELLKELADAPRMSPRFLATLIDTANLPASELRTLIAQQLARPTWSTSRGCLVDALLRSAQRRKFSMDSILGDKEIVSGWKEFVKAGQNQLQSDSEPIADRALATRLVVRWAPLDDAVVRELLSPTSPPELRLACIQMLGERNEGESLICDAWKGFTPAIRAEAIEMMLARPKRAEMMLEAIKANKVPASDLAVHRKRFDRHPDANVRREAGKLLGPTTSKRSTVVERYRASLKLSASADRGSAAFKKVCANCHRLANEGPQVGPDLRAVLASKDKPRLLVDLFDPNHDVDPRYAEYQVLLADGRTTTGLVAAETANSVTLRRAGGIEETLLRRDIDRLQATGISVMPEGLEKDLSVQEVADLLEFLMMQK